MAAAQGHTQTVKVLLTEGADLSLRDKQGRVAVLLCKDKRTRDVFDEANLLTLCFPAACTVAGVCFASWPRRHPWRVLCCSQLRLSSSRVCSWFGWSPHWQPCWHVRVQPGVQPIVTASDAALFVIEPRDRFGHALQDSGVLGVET